ncbi:MAG: 2-C-methyl-D-erythritol 4-phosphate cytidylyltransferase [Actinomycetota bacterium]
MSPFRPATVAIVLAAGAGRRLAADEPKAFLAIGGRPILTVAAAAAAASEAVDEVIVVVPAGLEDRTEGFLEGLDVLWRVVRGGDSRRASVRAALAALDDEVELVAVHDAARPFAPPDLFTSVLEGIGDDVEGAIPVTPVADTVKRVRAGFITATLPRDELALAQTPQAFRLSALRDAHERASVAGLDVTDDAQVMESAGYRVRAIAGDPRNTKITTMLDLVMADARMGGADA